VTTVGDPGVVSMPLSAVDAVSLLETELTRRHVEVSLEGYTFVVASDPIIRRTAWTAPTTPRPTTKQAPAPPGPKSTGAPPSSDSSSSTSGASAGVIGGAAGGLVVVLLVLVVLVLARRRRQRNKVPETPKNLEGTSDYRTGVINPLYGDVGDFGDEGEQDDDDEDGMYQDVHDNGNVFAEADDMLGPDMYYSDEEEPQSGYLDVGADVENDQLAVPNVQDDLDEDQLYADQATTDGADYLNADAFDDNVQDGEYTDVEGTGNGEDNQDGLFGFDDAPGFEDDDGADE